MYVLVLDPNNKMYIHGRDLYFLQNVGFSLDDGILEINNIKFAEWEKSSFFFEKNGRSSAFQLRGETELIMYKQNQG